MNFKAIKVDRNTERRIDTVTLNRPESLNALNPTMVNELLIYFQSLIDSSFRLAGPDQYYEPRVIILKGEGRAFCAGLDIVGNDKQDQVSPLDLGLNVGPGESLRAQRRIAEIVLRMRKVKQPIIALLNGATCGGGLALALASDIRLATKDFKANVAMATIGLTGCDIGISYFLPRHIGTSAAAEMMMTGRFLLANRALSLGLLSSVHESKSEMDVAANEMINDMLRLTEMALYLTKEGLQHSINASSLEHAVAMEDRQQVLASFDPHFQERVKAFGAPKAKKSKI